MKKKTYRWPTEEQLKEMRELLATGEASRPLPPWATTADKVKYAICQEFVKYYNRKKITQNQFAEILSVDKSIASKLIHCIYDDFTIDRLIRYLTTLYPDANISLKIA